MSRQPRLDAPGALHHVMVRGIEGMDIFRTDQDLTDFLARLAERCESEVLGIMTSLVNRYAMLPRVILLNEEIG